jgi:hypothetical protein
MELANRVIEVRLDDPTALGATLARSWRSVDADQT